MALTEHHIQVYYVSPDGRRIGRPFYNPKPGSVTIEELLNILGVRISNRRSLLNVRLFFAAGNSESSYGRQINGSVYLGSSTRAVEITKTAKQEAEQESTSRHIPISYENGMTMVQTLRVAGNENISVDQVLNTFYIKRRDGDRVVTLEYGSIGTAKLISTFQTIDTRGLTAIHIGKKRLTGTSDQPLEIKLHHSSPTADTTAAEENQPDAQASNNQNDTKEKLMSHVPVDATVPVQTITVVYGVDVNHMSKGQLFGAATAVKSEIDGLEKANEGIESVSISKQIAALKDHLVTIKGLLDAE